MAASAGAWYRVGTVNVTNGSAAIVGVGSNWQNDVIAIAIGDAFTIDAKTWYEVIAVNSDTSITLDRGFEGTTDNGVEYAILRNTSGTILTRIAGQIAVQFNQKQLFLDELRNWLTSEDETATLTDSHGIAHVVKTVNKIQEITGTAASKDVVSSNTDTTAGKLLTVGYAGIGSSASTATPAIFTDIDNTEVINAFSRRTTSQTGTLPLNFGNTAGLVFQQAWDSNTKFQQYIRAAAGVRIAWRTRSGGNWGDYVEAYHSGNTNFNEFGGLAAGDYIGNVTARNSIAARFYRPLSGWITAPSSISVTGTFKIMTRGTDVTVITGIPASDIVIDVSTSNCELNANIRNIDGTLIDSNLEYVLVSETSSSKITAVV